MAPETWLSRDRIVLDAAVELLDERSEIRDVDLQSATGFDSDTVQRALKGLVGPYLVPFGNQPGSGRIEWISAVTPKARVAVGAWPSAESLVDALVRQLAQIAEDPHTPVERRSKARELMAAFAGFGGEVAAGVLAGVIGGVLPS